MADYSSLNQEGAITFMVSAGLVYEIIAAACSSPQTAEINAGKRAGTLMKWVHMGMFQAALLVGIAAWLSKEPWYAISGGALAGGIMYAQYKHALSAGLKNKAEGGTESY